LPRVDYAREIVGLRLKPLYHVPNKYLSQGADKDGGATPKLAQAEDRAAAFLTSSYLMLSIEPRTYIKRNKVIRVISI